MLLGIDIPVLILFLAVFLLCYIYLNKRSNLPPGPRSLPLLGNFFWFMKVRNAGVRFPRALLKESQKYGDVVYMKLGRQGVCFLHGYDTIREALVKQADVHSDRPHWLPRLQEPLQEGKGIIWQSGHDWKVIRKFALQTLRDFGVGKTSLEEKILLEVDAATDLLTAASGEPVDVQHITAMMISNVIYGIVFGKRFDYDDPEFHKIIRNLDAIFSSGGALDPASNIPEIFLRIFYNSKLKEKEDRLVLLRWVKAHIYGEVEKHEQTFDKHNIRDFIDMYIQTKQEDEKSDIFTVGNIFRMIMDLFLAGSETTSTSITWVLLYMIEYPDVQKRCQEEIQQKYGDRVITWADKGTLPYVEATLKEIQRISNIAELTLPHTNEVDTTIKGYHIPRHTLIQANLYSASMDTKYWSQPETFNPERFLDGDKLKKNNAHIPFSTGPRVCLGESLAKMEMFLIFCNLIQRFTFAREDEHVPHSFQCMLTHITCCPVPYKCRALRRT